MKYIILLFAIAFNTNLMAQEDAIIFFTDKENVEASLADPISILTQDAIDRKELQGTPIDARDVPVNENYITTLKNVNGLQVLSKSKWMNTAFVRGTFETIQGLGDLDFVAGIEYLDKSLNFAPVPLTQTPDKFEVENTPTRVTYNYGAATNQVEMLNAQFLHELDFTGEEMVIAVMDSGFPNVFTNPAFSDIVSDGRILGTYDFAERQTNVDGTGSHGARTFSDIGGFLEDEFVGTAPDASFYLFRTEFGPSENPVEEAWWLEALERSDSLGVDVVNTSLGYQDYDNPAYDHSYEDLDGQTTIGARGANHAFDKGLLLVTSGGNDGQSFMFVATPADAPGILTVGAVEADESYASFSSIGPTVDGRIKPDVMAQGRDAAVVDQFGDVTTNSGTSFSAPIMAGAVACLWESRPQSRNSEVMQVVRESAHLYNNPTAQMGYGIPDFSEAYNALSLLSNEDVMLARNFAVYPNPAQDYINISFPDSANIARVEVYNIFGKLLQSKAQFTEDDVLDISSFSTGVYFVRISAENSSNSFKIVKQ